MAYYINKTIKTNFDQAIELITEALKTEGFGIISEIDAASLMAVDIKAKLKKAVESL